MLASSTHAFSRYSRMVAYFVLEVRWSAMWSHLVLQKLSCADLFPYERHPRIYKLSKLAWAARHASIVTQPYMSLQWLYYVTPRTFVYPSKRHLAEKARIIRATLCTHLTRCCKFVTSHTRLKHIFATVHIWRIVPFILPPFVTINTELWNQHQQLSCTFVTRRGLNQVSIK